MKNKNNISLDGQFIEINDRKYALIEHINDKIKPLMKIYAILDKVKYGKKVNVK